MRPAAKVFSDLLVWQRAHTFVLGVYALTAKFPKHEIYSLSIQMRRAAVPFRQTSQRDFGSAGSPIRCAS
jgi:hypothetical protein